MTFTQQDLTAKAGVDPWGLQKKLAAGDPSEIEELASRFYTASGQMSEAHTSHTLATKYKQQGYTVNGSPVDYDAEIAHAKTLSGASEHLGQIAKVLRGVGTEL